MYEYEQKSELEPWKKSSEDVATLMKTRGSGTGAMFKKRRAPEPELWHFYDGYAALK